MVNEDKTKIAKRIRDLLKLSDSGNANEAAVAMAAAVKLADRHRLSLAQVQLEPVDEKPVIVDVAKKLPRWKLVVAKALAEANHCACCEVVGGTEVAFVGIYDDINTAKAMFHHCCAVLVRLSRRLPSYSRRGFLFGAACGVDHQVENAKRELRSEACTTALAVVDKRSEAVRKLLDEKNVPSKQIPTGSTGSGFTSGFATGSNLPLARGQLR